MLIFFFVCLFVSFSILKLLEYYLWTLELFSQIIAVLNCTCVCS